MKLRRAVHRTVRFRAAFYRMEEEAAVRKTSYCLIVRQRKREKLFRGLDGEKVSATMTFRQRSRGWMTPRNRGMNFINSL